MAPMTDDGMHRGALFMKALKKERKERFDEMAGEYLRSPVVTSMDKYVQHGDTSTLGHCENVAWVSFMVNEKLHLNANGKILVEAAILHDFYLYDWHDGKPERKRHGFDHPDIACENAKEHFHVSEEVQYRDNIRCVCGAQLDTSSDWLYTDKEIHCRY